MFCEIYCKNNSNAKKAAVKAGFSEKSYEKILAKPEIKNYINNFKVELEREKIFKTVILNLNKIIETKVNDVIVLAANFETITKKEIEKLNLFQLAEIKKLKDGSFEFKLIDKIKAIETLTALLEKLNVKENKTQINEFLDALTTKVDCEKT